MSNSISRYSAGLSELRHLEEMARHYDDRLVASLPRATIKHRLRMTYWAQSLACSVDQHLHLHVTDLHEILQKKNTTNKNLANELYS